MGLVGVEKGVREAEASRLILFQVFVGHVAIGLLGEPKDFDGVLHRSLLMLDRYQPGLPPSTRCIESTGSTPDHEGYYARLDTGAIPNAGPWNLRLRLPILLVSCSGYCS